jgi:hypothetical protein
MKVKKHYGFRSMIAVGAVALVLGSAIGSLGYWLSADSKQAGPASAPPVTPSMSSASSAPRHAMMKSCDVLRTNYPTVASAVDDREKYNTRSWNDPDLLASVNRLVDAMNTLAEKLEGSLNPDTPGGVRTAIVDYVAGLRAVSISERNHASNTQLNGTSLFYNQVMAPALRECGMPG